MSDQRGESPCSVFNTEGDIVTTDTAPSTPARASQAPILYGILGGGDLPVTPRRAPASGHGNRGLVSQRATLSQRGMGSGARNRSLLGSPLSLRPSGFGRGRPIPPRPLVRAAQAPIPLWEYPAPTSTGRLGPDQATPTHLVSPSSRLGSNDNRVRPSSCDDFTAVISLAVVAAINRTIQEDVLGHEASSSSAYLEDALYANLEWMSETGAPERTFNQTRCDTDNGPKEPGANPASKDDFIPATDAASQTLSGVSSIPESTVITSTVGYVPPSSPLAPLAHDQSMYGLGFGIQQVDPGDVTWGSPVSRRRGTVVPVDGLFLITCNIRTFNPRRPTYTCLDILLRLMSQWGWTTGITKTEIKQIFKACALCHKYMYAERRGQHRCDARSIDILSPQFELSQSLVSFEEHSGLTQADLTSLLSQCDDCGRVVHVPPGADANPTFCPHRCPSMAGNGQFSLNG